jgi:glycosyltransferase involved in cell wall biosynthesis
MNAQPYLSLLRVSVWGVPGLRNLLREIEPDVVLSFLGATNIITIAAAKDLPSRVVISERNDPSRQQLNPPWEGLRPLIYPVADVVTANSHGAVEHLQGYCASTTLAYVPNPVVIPDEGSRQQGNSILFLARLVHQNGPDILIDAFARFVKDNPDWSLEIVALSFCNPVASKVPNSAKKAKYVRLRLAGNPELALFFTFFGNSDEFGRFLGILGNSGNSGRFRNVTRFPENAEKVADSVLARLRCRSAGRFFE